MILERLTISKKYKYKADEPIRFEGAIKYSGGYGEVTVVLNDETSRKVLEVIADQLVETSKQVAHNLTAEIIESANPLLTNGDT